MVLRERDTIPKFLDKNPDGRFKGRNPIIDKSELPNHYVEGSHTIYIGKGNKLQRRMKQFINFGSGKPIGHWGGRLVWQIENSDDFFVAWKCVDDQDPSIIESQMFKEFNSTYHKLLYANLKF
ncbi:TPA: hypothetical protein ENS27_08125 [bacterium]|nr:hypothetical protein [bacterium]